MGSSSPRVPTGSPHGEACFSDSVSHRTVHVSVGSFTRSLLLRLHFIYFIVVLQEGWEGRQFFKKLCSEVDIGHDY